jgi:hypothetical protein
MNFRLPCLPVALNAVWVDQRELFDCSPSHRKAVKQRPKRIGSA